MISLFILMTIGDNELMMMQRAVESGAEAVAEPEDKGWGQKVGYVKDVDGIVVRLGSHVRS